MICPIFLPLSHPREQRIVEEALIERFNFCCEALHPIPFTHLNHGEEYAIPPQQEPRGARTRRVISYYRQYVHRTMSCYVRMTQTGLVWISNRKLASDDVQGVFDGLRCLVSSVRVAHAALEDVIERVFETQAAPASESVAPAFSTRSARNSRSAVTSAATRVGDGDADDESGFASEADKTDSNTTDEDNEQPSSSGGIRTNSSSVEDDDKENAAPSDGGSGIAAAANLQPSPDTAYDALASVPNRKSSAALAAATASSKAASEAPASGSGPVAAAGERNAPAVDSKMADPDPTIRSSSAAGGAAASIPMTSRTPPPHKSL